MRPDGKETEPAGSGRPWLRRVGDWLRPADRSIRTRLVVLVAAVLVPVLLFTGVVVIENARDQRKAIERRAEEAAQTTVRLVDAHVLAIEPVLQAVAALPAAVGLDMSAFVRAAVAAAARLGHEIALLDRNGQFLASTRATSEGELPRRTDMTPLAAAFDSNGLMVTDLLTGVLSGRPVALVTIPLRRDGRVDSLVVASVSPASLEAALREAGLPEGWIAAIVDRNGVYVTRSRLPDNYVGQTARPEVIAAARSGRAYGHFDNINWEGIPQWNVYLRSPVTGWIAVIGVPHELLAAPLRRAVGLLAGGAFLAGLALALAVFLARRIAEPVSALQGAAVALAHGARLPARTGRISELTDVWRAFEQAGRIVRERNAVEAALRDSAERLTLAGSIARLAFVDIDLLQHCWTASDNFAEVMGFSPCWTTADEARKTWLDNVHPDDRARVAAEFASLLGTLGSGHSDYRVVCPDCPTRWIETTWLAQANAGGGVGRVLIISQDVTQRRRAEEADALLASVVGASHDAIFSVGPDRIILSWNSAATRLYGYTAAEAIGRPLAIIAPADLLAEQEHNSARVLTGGERIYFETVRRRKDGSLVEVGISGAPMQAADGRFLGLAAVHRDISERRRIEDALRINAAFLELSQAVGNIGSWEWFLDRDEVRWSRQFFSILGYDPDTTTPNVTALMARVHPDDRAMLENERRAGALGEETDGNCQFRIIRPDGEVRWMERRARIVEGPPRRMIGVNIDITERKRREEHVELLMHELSHRTKNLLAVVQALARQLSRASTGAADFEQRFSARIQALASAQDLLVQQRWQGAPLEDLIRAQLSAFADTDQGRVILSGPLVMLRLEAVQNLSLVLHELATNAAKYGALSVPGGTITIDWTSEDDTLVFVWRERGGPRVTPPTRTGFGHTIINRMLAQGLHAQVSLDYPPEGACVTLRIPRGQIAPDGGRSGKTPPSS